MPDGEPRRGSLNRVLLALIAVFVIGGEAHATEGGGSQIALGAATILQGVQPTPPGFNLINYDAYYLSNRLNNSHGDKAIPKFHVDLMVSFIKLDYSFPKPIGGIRFGVSLGLPFVRANVSTGRGAAAFHQEKAGSADIGVAPFVAGWEYDTPIGHVNQFARLVIVTPTGSFEPTRRLNLGRNYVAYHINQGNSLFPTENTNIGFQLIGGFNEKNSATNYQSGKEFEVDWSGGYDIDRNWSVELNWYYYQQVTNDYRAGVLVNGDGNKGRSVGIGPQFRLKFHPGAVTLKWQTEMAVQNRAQGNRFWLQFYYPL